MFETISTDYHAKVHFRGQKQSAIIIYYQGIKSTASKFMPLNYLRIKKPGRR